MCIFPILGGVAPSQKRIEPVFTQLCFPDKTCIQAELAFTVKQRALGLMFREKLERDKGMLFIFPEDGFWSFWMKNTKITLDMIWIDRDKTIVNLIENVPPCSKDPCKTYTSMKRARYVLELAGGMVKEHGLKVGDKLEFSIPEKVKKVLKNEQEKDKD